MRKERQWNDSTAIDEFLANQEVAHLTTIDADGWPQAIPLNYIWHGGSIYIHSGNGGKITNLRANPKVAITVTEALGLITSEISESPCGDSQLGSSVLIRGVAREIKDAEIKYKILHKFIAKYDPEALNDPIAERMAPESLMAQPAFRACLIIEIAVEKLTARQHLLFDKSVKYRKTIAAHFQQKAQKSGLERDFRTALLLNKTLE